MLARVHTASLVGLSARPITVEVDLSRGLPTFHLVGLPDGVVRESRERVTAALANSGFALPLRRITVNLAPADEPKSGSAFDLPIALAILQADGTVAPSGSPLCALGELALDGSVRPVRGVLPAAAALAARGAGEVLVAAENAREAALVEGLDAIPVESLREAVDHVSGLARIEPATAPRAESRAATPGHDWSQVRGQEAARRALEIAAAGFHNALLIGPPGAGKTFLARRLPTVLPPLEPQEALEVTAIHSAWGRILSPDRPLVTTAPFRAPHHSVSAAAFLGGGSPPRAGEVTLAHRGVLFLDELPEFRRDALEGLRQPLEDGEVMIGRVRQRHRFPTRFLLVGAMNPCPCGWWGDERRACRCTPGARRIYRARVSGPLLDRIDLHVLFRPVEFGELLGGRPAERSAAVRERVEAARTRQQARGRLNAALEPDSGDGWDRLDPESRRLLKGAHACLGLSARAHVRVLRVARTIADLDGRDVIDPSDIAEAVQYRALDRPMPEPDERNSEKARTRAG